jgi:hypothetical protein
MQENASLTPKQEQVIVFLLEGNTILETAEKAKVNQATIHRWQKEAVFQEAFAKARKRTLDQSFTSLQLKFNKAVDTLDRHMDAPNTIPRDQVKAAEVVVDKTIQISQLTERIASLEAELTALKEEQEQGQEYIVKFDLRDLTKEERETLRAIDASVASRKTL